MNIGSWNGKCKTCPVGKSGRAGIDLHLNHGRGTEGFCSGDFLETVCIEGKIDPLHLPFFFEFLPKIDLLGRSDDLGASFEIGFISCATIRHGI